MKAVIGIVVLALVSLGGFVFFGTSDVVEEVVEETTEVVEEKIEASVSDGEYQVIPDLSKVNWAGKKPLIDGYINSGTIGVVSGAISLYGASSTGSFEMDMSTLTVGETKAKPGAESMLEGHLKGEGWFNVEEFPTASFTITRITPAESPEDTFLFNVVGDLTMKGETNEVSFPARIYASEDGTINAEASFEIDRTLWGITSGSGSFFDDLADNVIDDMVALSFKLVAVSSDEKVMEEGATMEVPSLDSQDIEETVVEVE